LLFVVILCFVHLSIDKRSCRRTSSLHQQIHCLSYRKHISPSQLFNVVYSIWVRHHQVQACEQSNPFKSHSHIDIQSMERIQFEVSSSDRIHFLKRITYSNLGIDAILSVYDNGIQLTFTRQPHVVIFFPIASLIYCSGVRFSTIADEQTSHIDWRFMPIDDMMQTIESKHPPLFCAVIHRTQIMSGNECHCFITKSTDAALALVRSITEIYANVRHNQICSRSPIFYQVRHLLM
jgi:hypothetical protein